MIRPTFFGSFESPEGWSDETIYRFAAPPAATDAGIPADPLPTSVTVLRATIPGTAQEYLETTGVAQLAHLRNGQVESRESWRHPTLGELPTLEISHELRPSERIHQALVYVPTGAKAQIVLLTFTAPARSFDAARPTFRRILESLTFETDASGPSSA